MNFRRYVTLNEEADSFINEVATKVLNGEEVAKDLGITRTAVKLITQRALTKLYTSISKVDSSLSPFHIFMVLCTLMEVVSDEKGIKDVLRNISSAQKQEVIADIKDKYPNMDLSKFGVK